MSTNRLHAYLVRRSVSQIAAGCLSLTLFVAVIDYITGYELSFSVFYLAPIMVAAWYGDRRFAYFLCLLCAATWLLVELLSGKHYSQPAIMFWNAGVRLGFFVLAAYLLLRLRASLQMQIHLAQRDGLTGVLSAREFRERSRLLFELARRHQRPVTLAYLDLDDFRAVNDQLGHNVGDNVLCEVAEVLELSVRTSDLVTRLGGDEFVVLLPDTEMHGARRVFSALQSQLLQRMEERHWPVAFSIGVAVFPELLPELNEAIKFADNLMYSVKQAGKNDIAFSEYQRSN